MTAALTRWFDDHGWAAADASIFAWGKTEQLQRIRAAFDEVVVAGIYSTGHRPHGVNNFGDKLIKVSNAWLANDVIAEVVRDKHLAQLACDMLGVEELYLWADSLYWKAPYARGEQGQIGWHQDKQYWQTSSTEKMITACIALYDTKPGMGGLRFADGSHRWGLVGGSDAISAGENAEPHARPPVPPGRIWSEICPEMPAGSVTFHHCLTFHGSGPNLAETPRRSITIHMVAAEGRLVNWSPVADGYLETVGLGNPFRGPLFPRLYP